MAALMQFLSLKSLSDSNGLLLGQGSLKTFAAIYLVLHIPSPLR